MRWQRASAIALCLICLGMSELVGLSSRVKVVVAQEILSESQEQKIRADKLFRQGMEKFFRGQIGESLASWEPTEKHSSP